MYSTATAMRSAGFATNYSEMVTYPYCTIQLLQRAIHSFFLHASSCIGYKILYLAVSIFK